MSLIPYIVSSENSSERRLGISIKKKKNFGGQNLAAFDF
jgi:hypothetical protein